MDKITLQAIQNVLATSLTDTLISLIKDESNRKSNRTGKQLAFNLYRILDKLAKTSQHFTITLELYADEVAPKNNSSENEQSFEVRHRSYFAESALMDSAKFLKESLKELNHTLDEIYPQLNVHRHDLVENIIVYSMTRGGTIFELPEIENEEQLWNAVERTKINHQRIEMVINEYRIFLAKEFSFRDSFEGSHPLIGEVKMETQETYNIHDVTGSVINIKSNLERVVQRLDAANPQTTAEQGKLDELKNLINQLQTAIEPVAKQNPRGAERITKQVEVVAEEVASGTPDKSYLNVTAEGLKKAAEAVADIAPTVLSIAGKISAFVAGM